MSIKIGDIFRLGFRGSEFWVLGLFHTCYSHWALGRKGRDVLVALACLSGLWFTVRSMLVDCTG